MRVSFIGLGIMGSRMALNLLQKKGLELTVYNRSQDPVRELTAAGASPAATLYEAVEGADVVFTMLSTPEVVEHLAFGPEGFTSQLSCSSIWVDCSTVDPFYVRTVAERARRQGFRYLEAPVAGTKPHAEQAELVFLWAEKKPTWRRSRPYWIRWGKKSYMSGNNPRAPPSKCWSTVCWHKPW